MFLLCIFCCLTLENVAQNVSSNNPTIIPTNLIVAEKSMKKLKACLKKPEKAGKGINVSIAELRSLLDKAELNGASSVFLFVVGMDKENKDVWGQLNPLSSEKDWEDRPALMLKYTVSVKKLSSLQRFPAMVSPFTMIFGNGLNLPYQDSEWYALGALCPPPTDCTFQ